MHWNLLKVKTLNAFGRVEHFGEGHPETLVSG